MLTLTAAALSACSQPPDEQRLRDTVAAMQAHIEQHEVGSLRDLLAEDFVGQDGLDRKGAHRLAQVMFLRYRNVGLNLGPLEIDLRGSGSKKRYATVRFTAMLTGGAGLLPDSGRWYDVETGWRLEDEEWKLVTARWKSAL